MTDSPPDPRPPQTVVPPKRVPVRSGPSRLSNTFAALLLIALAAFVYARFSHAPAPAEPTTTASTPHAAATERPIDLGPVCDGRTQCTQMTSCTEAKFFLQTCPDVQLDRNRNGVPCEKSLCNTPLAR